MNEQQLRTLLERADERRSATIPYVDVARCEKIFRERLRARRAVLCSSVGLLLVTGTFALLFADWDSPSVATPESATSSSGDTDVRVARLHVQLQELQQQLSAQQQLVDELRQTQSQTRIELERAELDRMSLTSLHSTSELAATHFALAAQLETAFGDAALAKDAYGWLANNFPDSRWSAEATRAVDRLDAEM